VVSVLRAGGDAPPRKASALRTNRLSNKDIGKSGQNLARASTVSPLDEDNPGTDVPDARTRYNRDLEPSAPLSKAASRR
jgi:hypothetical protein